MGVQGLWQLLEPTGKPVTLESLEGKVLAVDISMWLHQSMKGMRDKQGNAIHNAHLHVLFNRICKLLFYKIKPVFVFDGGVPALKKQTLAKRRQKRVEAGVKKDLTAEKLLGNILKHHAVSTVLGSASSDSHIQMPAIARDRDMFELNPIPEVDIPEEPYADDSWEERISNRNALYAEFQNIEDINVESEEFNSLPADIRYEILSDLKETRKSNSWTKVESLPTVAKEFSNYQMAKLMKQSKLSQKIYNVRKELNCDSTEDVKSHLGDSNLGMEVITSRVVSEDSTHYILVKGLSQIPKEIAKEVNENKASDVYEEEDEVSLTQKCADILNGKFTGKSSERCVVKEIDEDLEITLFKKSSQSPSSNSDVVEIDIEKDIDNQKEDFNMEGGFLREDSDSDCEVIESSNVKHDITGGISTTSLFPPEDRDKKGASLDIGGNQLKRKGLTQSSSTPPVKIHRKDNGDRSVDESDKLCSESNDKDNDDEHKLFTKTDDLISRNVSVSKQYIARKQDSIVVAINGAKTIESNHSKHLQDIEGEKEKSIKTDKVEDESSESESDDFIEVIVDPAKINTDDLFPATMFEPSVNNINKSEIPTEDRDVVFIKATSVSEPAVNIDADMNEDDDVAEVTSIKNDDDDNNDVISAVLVSEEKDNEFKGITESELVDIQLSLEAEASDLVRQKGKQERLATSITDQLQKEAQELLLLFGVPYVIAPMEAEAQCAFLDLTNQTNGTITDDSDIWLFGGKSVYRNFFNKNKSVECFEFGDIEKVLMLDRCRLINIGYLCGCDYTNGIAGIGPVTAMEILLEFPGEGIGGLENMKSWWDEACKVKVARTGDTKLKEKLKTLELGEGFPNKAVFKAFINPEVDESMEKFQWNSPDLDLLRDFAMEKLNWTKDKTDELLLPVIKKLNAKESQTQIRNFFSKEWKESQSPVKSKRVKRIINRMKDNGKDEGGKGKKSSKGKASKKHPAKKSKDNKADAQSGGFTTCNTRKSRKVDVVNLSESSSDSANE